MVASELEMNFKYPYSRIFFFIFLASFSVLSAADENAQNSSKIEAIKDVAPEEIKTIAPDTTRMILNKFKNTNPTAREYRLGKVSEAYTEDNNNPGLKLERMWTSDQATLLEVVGLPRPNQTYSAIISPDTLALVNMRTMNSSRLLEYDGATQLLDKRGVKAIGLKPNETMYLLMQSADIKTPVSLDYIGWDGKSSKYFDKIDPMFRERYDDYYRAASAIGATPEQMKDFLVEFANEDPDKRAPQVFLALINKMRAQNTFEGYYTAYLLLKDVNDAKAAFKLAKTEEHFYKIENIAVASLADKSRLLDLSISTNPSSTSSDEARCWMFCLYKFNARRSVSGNITLKAKSKNTPIKLKMGTYKVTLVSELKAPVRFVRESKWLGDADKNASNTETRTHTLILSPPNYSATIPADFGSILVAFFERGSAGGNSGQWATGDGALKVKFKSMELVQ